MTIPAQGRATPRTAQVARSLPAVVPSQSPQRHDGLGVAPATVMQLGADRPLGQDAGIRDEGFRSARAVTRCRWWLPVTREAGSAEVVMSPSGTTLPLRINP